jgi:hypothetical protein
MTPERDLDNMSQMVRRQGVRKCQVYAADQQVRIKVKRDSCGGEGLP